MRSRRIRAFLFLILAAACAASAIDTRTTSTAGTRDAMRQFVIAVAEQARAQDPTFLVVPQNGLGLLTMDGRPTGTPIAEYLSAIDGVGQEDLSYGYTGNGIPTPVVDHERLLAFLDLAERSGLSAIVVDYCSDPAHVRHALALDAEHGFAGYAAPSPDLKSIASDALQPLGASARNVDGLSEARNVLYLLNPERYGSRAEFIRALAETDYDLFVVDAWFRLEEALVPEDIAALQRKPGGGRRLVLAYLSIGEAEDYRSDWNPVWTSCPPDWLGNENPDWPGNYAVRFWYPEWRAIVMARLGALVEVGFDGVYLDKVDAYEAFETP